MVQAATGTGIRPGIKIVRTLSLRAVPALLALVVIGFSLPALALDTRQADEFAEALKKPFFGDFDDIAKRGYVRVLVPFSKTFYFIDAGVQRGASVDLMREFGKFLLDRHGKSVRDGHIVFIPTSRDRLFTDLAEGRGDIALGNLTITEERLKLAEFSLPVFTGVREVPVTRTDTEAIVSPEGLSGKRVHVRPSSSYYQSLEALNEKLEADGKDPVELVTVSDVLEDEDLLELLAAGGIDLIIMDEHKADFWLQILDGLKTHAEAAVRKDGEIAIAVRKNAPKLLEEVSGFAKTVKKGTLLGNIILKRYLKDTKYIEKLQAEDRNAKFEQLSSLFRTYGEQYAIDWLLISAQSFQESKFDQSVRSKAGAVGLMQIKPSTAADRNIGIKGVAEDAEKNVHAGVKYLRFLADTYFNDLKDDPANQTFFALAAYNAGPSRFDRFRKEAEEKGYDPNLWFGNVEWIVGARVSREPVRYVGNIFKYYLVFSEDLKRDDIAAEAARSVAR
ncbi:transglycosylase SLT domain-containing protein [Roseibium sp.]|uniref:transglycosylase SLT domain-containing protein n=1 Tax=Roseibium sp. TaxID=1936156 RepID=UPI003A98674B